MCGALLTDLSKAFDCLPCSLLIVKLRADGFGKSCREYLKGYLSGRKQKIKINKTFSKWATIFHVVPQDSILASPLSNILLCDHFPFTLSIDLVNYADDNTSICNRYC